MGDAFPISFGISGYEMGAIAFNALAGYGPIFGAGFGELGDRQRLGQAAAREVPIPIVDGHADVPEEPGFGVEPNPAIVEKYLVR